MLTRAAIEKALVKNQPPGSDIHFDHDHEAILWFDTRTHAWCMSFYMVDNGQVHVDPGPTMSFKKTIA